MFKILTFILNYDTIFRKIISAIPDATVGDHNQKYLTMNDSFSIRFCTPDAVSRLRVVHYGADRFDPSRLVKVINLGLGHKPAGGLWTSPEGASWSWKDVVGSDIAFSSWTTDTSFTLSFSSEARVAVVDSLHDLLALPRISAPAAGSSPSVDWERLSMLADAVWLTAKGRRETRLSVPMDLTLWDCETVLIFNSGCMTQ